MNLHDFDEIRPYSEDEMPVIFKELLADRQFNRIMRAVLPGIPRGLRNALLRLMYRGVKTSQDFQLRFMKPIVCYLIWKCTNGMTFDYPKDANKHGRYVFLSNHRDIVLDSAFLDVALFKHGFERTVEIGIGDNLLIYPWIKKLVRMNKAFTVRRGLTTHEMMRSSVLMSQYIHFAVNAKQENVWIAQREGRAKDSDDRTQDSVLKMFCLGAPEELVKRPGITPSEATVEALKDLHIVPLTISYEYDPCDYLKAREMQQRRDNPRWRKTKADDLRSMQTGINGFKGRVTYRLTPSINHALEKLLQEQPEAKQLNRNEQIQLVCNLIDRQIHAGYEIYPHDAAFDKYIESRLALIKLSNKDEAFLREKLYEMYNNPIKNYEKSHLPG